VRAPRWEGVMEFAVGGGMLVWWAVLEGQRRGLIAHSTLWTTSWAAALVVAAVCAWRLR